MISDKNVWKFGDNVSRLGQDRVVFVRDNSTADGKIGRCCNEHLSLVTELVDR